MSKRIKHNKLVGDKVTNSNIISLERSKMDFKEKPLTPLEFISKQEFDHLSTQTKDRFILFQNINNYAGGLNPGHHKFEKPVELTNGQKLEGYSVTRSGSCINIQVYPCVETIDMVITLDGFTNEKDH